jgi:MOSC domain-containing protein YiiM
VGGKVVAVCRSAHKGERKKNIEEGFLQAGQGLLTDAHGGDWHRMLSLLAMESIDSMRAKGLDVGPGDFAENITTAGIELATLPVGTRLRLGDSLVEVTQIGKECHHRCAIYYQAGDCVMPREGIFARIIESGKVAVGDPVEILTGE